MIRRVEYASWFDADFRLRTAWYAENGDIELGERFVKAVESTVKRITTHPELGRRPYPQDESLARIHSVLVEKPFHKHVIFYRFSTDLVSLERLIHGARDLPRRIQQSPYESE